MKTSTPVTALRSSALALLALGLVSSGCSPTCQQACRKALSCDVESDRVSVTACEQECQRQEDLYSSWGDEAKQDALAAHKECLVDASCDEIADGACYDAQIFVF